MEADWEVEVGADSAVIDGAWDGWVDLLREPERVRELTEVIALPALGEALIALNDAGSALWTAKCDVWPLEEFDALEMDANADAASAWAAYIDLLPRAEGVFESVDGAVQWSRAAVARLYEIRLRSCRVDVVTRAALGRDAAEGYGVTAYLSACGSDDAAARAQLSELLSSLATLGTIQYKHAGE